MSIWKLPIGASPSDEGVVFRVWAPTSAKVEVVHYSEGGEDSYEMEREKEGYFRLEVKGAAAGARYRYRIDGEAYPDPASRYQPEGVHGPSQVVDPSSFTWSDAAWRGIPLREMVIYELHVGTFTAEGTFDSAIERLPALRELGVNTIEVMPIANFPGARNWGYDGVNLFAPATAYGGPDAFRRLVDAAHSEGLAVLLDVVYNHLGPEGNYLPAVTGGRFFTDRHKTPWGDAVNYDGPDSGPVRDFVLNNARHWMQEYHVDGLRLDATHAIIDDSPVHLLRELATVAHSAPTYPRVLIAEDERNDRKLILPPDAGGYGLDAVWADDLHHQLRRLAAGDREGYFASYGGTLEEVATTLRKGWFYEGQRSPHTNEPRGTPASGIPPERFIHCLQNHDQVGNRAFGDRLTESVELSVYRALSALLLLSPYTPLLWMGQEWASSSPFLYFTDHPEALGKLVTGGRREEFGHFSAFSDPAIREKIPDPQAAETFARSRLDWSERVQPPHAGVLSLYRELLSVRRRHQVLLAGDDETLTVTVIAPRVLALRRDAREVSTLLLVAFESSGDAIIAHPALLPPTRSSWKLVLATEESRFGGRGDWGDFSAGELRLSGPGAVVLQAVVDHGGVEGLS